MSSWPEIFGTIPGWITAASTSTALGVVGGIWLKSRKVTIEEKESDRDGYGELINVLTSEVGKMKLNQIENDRRVQETSNMCTAMQLRMGQLEFGLRLLLDELERVDATSPVLKQVKGLLAALYPIPVVSKDFEGAVHGVT